MSNPGEDSSSVQLPAAGGSGFPDTLWTVVRQASQQDDDTAAQALRKLCAMYREPIVARLRRQGRLNDAEDLANGFIEFLLEKNRLRNFVRTNAKFRDLLLIITTLTRSAIRTTSRRRIASPGNGTRFVVRVEIS